ncbi:hypothetical protein J3B02_004002, partial [Coemansia erecta]
EEEDDKDEDEDADFEAPTVSIAYPKPSESVAVAADTLGEDTQLGKNHRPETDAESDSAVQNQSEAIPTSESKTNNTLVSDPKTEHAVPDEVELLLLPTKSLPEYIPVQCPAFPSPHTFKHTPVFPKREQDFFRNRMHKAEQSRQAEENLQRLISGPIAVDAASTASASASAPESAPESAQVPTDKTGTGLDHSSSLDTQHQHPGPTEPSSKNTQPEKPNPQQARKRIFQLFPPANFRNADKRTRLASFF